MYPRCPRLTLAGCLILVGLACSLSAGAQDGMPGGERNAPAASVAAEGAAPAREAPAAGTLETALPIPPPPPRVVPAQRTALTGAQAQATPAPKPPEVERQIVGGEPVTATAAGRVFTVDVNKSQLIRLPRPARDALVANPTIADVVLRSADTAFVVGRKVGETSVHFLDAQGREIDRIDVIVSFDYSAVSAALKRMIPEEHIDLATANNTLVLLGSVSSPQVAENARAIVRRFVADDNSVISLLHIRDKSQVLIRVTVSEMSRTIEKELGISPTYTGKHITFTPAPQTLPAGLEALMGTIPIGKAATLTTLLQALEQDGLTKTLAEPNLTAISGETASFLVGGEFPVPSPQTTSGTAPTITVTYQEFGVRLTFTPVVLSGGLISLRIATEVSELSTQGEIAISGFTIPALTVRRAETTVELPAGGSIAIAGLLQNDIVNSINGFPFLKDIPILGALFRSTDFQRNETDLVISVTPYLVRPANPSAIAYPTDGFGPASDFNMALLGLLHATYAKPAGAAPHADLKGQFGFILE